MSIDPIVEDEKKVFSNDTVEIVLYKFENEHYLKISANGWSTEINNLDLTYNSKKKDRYGINIENTSKEIMKFCVAEGVKTPEYQIENENANKSQPFSEEVDEKRFIDFLKNELNNPTQYKEIKNQFKQNLYNLLN